MLVEAPPADQTTGDVSPGPRTLAVDIGGSHLKAGLLGPAGNLVGDYARIETPHPATPVAVMAALGPMLRALGAADRVSAGFPGAVRAGVVLTAPNLGTPAWHGFALADALASLIGKPARVLNDATVQGLGVIAGRDLECVITLGTGMGFALFQDGRITPHLELSRHPVHKDKLYDDYIGNAERVRIGTKRWNRRVGRVIVLLRSLTSFDTLLIGGGNAKYLHADLPADVRIVSNQAGVTGGVKLWSATMDEAFQSPAPALTAVMGYV